MKNHADGMKSGCKFCEKFGEASGGNQIADHVLFESANFVVVPTVGSIIPGWLLVVPRSHFLSVGSTSVVPKTRVVADDWDQRGREHSDEHHQRDHRG